MDARDLAYAGIARQADLIRAGEISSRKLVEHYLERITRLDPELNAGPGLARTVQRALARPSRPVPPRLVAPPIVDETARAAVEETAELLRGLGHEIRERDLE
ncbi:MAG: hypothetical protein ACRDL1_02315 [Solirubrobacterales bacterium]